MLYFKKNLKIKKLPSIVNIFVFFIKISCRSKESLLSKKSPLLFQPLPF